MGSGANSYMFEVPQADYISQNYSYGANSYDVKAHCWYLQQWVETGLIGTLALLVFCSGIWYSRYAFTAEWICTRVSAGLDLDYLRQCWCT